MSRALLLSVRFHDGRYHGADDWPPAPARLFQALLAGSARGKDLPRDAKDALGWLEALAPPVIAAPRQRKGGRYKNYVPSNDLDTTLKHDGSIDAAVAKIRVGKMIQPHLFDSDTPFLYLWTIIDDDPESDRHALYLCHMVKELYQLGRGVDMAWAQGEVLDQEAGERRLADHGGTVHRPGGNGTHRLACPARGSLDSLIERHDAQIRRLSTRYQNKQVFTQPPKPRFARIAYDSPPWHGLYEIRDAAAAGSASPEFAPWPASDVVRLVELARGNAAARLCRDLDKTQINRLVIGRDAGPRDKAERLRIVPLPSIGHPHADYGIRRLLVEAPPNCPIKPGDIDWAFAGLDLDVDAQTGEVLRDDGPRCLLPAAADQMLKHYGIDDGASHRLWRSVTPAALPFAAGRTDGRKSGQGRLEEEKRTVQAITQALRHTDITARPTSIRVQREPFDTKGARAETFATGRFSAARLWHLEIIFKEPVPGPLVIGDGRYVGLGLMRPVRGAGHGLWIFAIPAESRIGTADASQLLQAVRRALMALSRTGDKDVPVLFSGHESNGGPARSGQHRHVFLAADDADGDGHIDRLLVAAPWLCDRLQDAPKAAMRAGFDEAVLSLRQLRAGRLGVLEFSKPAAPLAGDPVVGPGQTWISRTPYRPTRHARRDPEAAVCEDAVLECRRRGLPAPRVDLLDFRTGPKGGNPSARLRLRFATAVQGPLLLGRDSHHGGGLFVVENGADDAPRPPV